MDIFPTTYPQKVDYLEHPPAQQTGVSVQSLPSDFVQRSQNSAAPVPEHDYIGNMFLDHVRQREGVRLMQQQQQQQQQQQMAQQSAPRINPGQEPVKADMGQPVQAAQLPQQGSLEQKGWGPSMLASAAHIGLNIPAAFAASEANSRMAALNAPEVSQRTAHLSQYMPYPAARAQAEREAAEAAGFGHDQLYSQPGQQGAQQISDTIKDAYLRGIDAHNFRDSNTLGAITGSGNLPGGHLSYAADAGGVPIVGQNGVFSSIDDARQNVMPWQQRFANNEAEKMQIAKHLADLISLTQRGATQQSVADTRAAAQQNAADIRAQAMMKTHLDPSRVTMSQVISPGR